MKHFRPVLFFLLALLPMTLTAMDGGYIVQTGHIGAVGTMQYSKAFSLLFSGGYDGTLRGWNAENGEATFRIQVSHLPIRLLAVHPLLPRVACLETDGINTFIISVWDFRENRRISVHRIQEMPLFLTYSPSGTFLVYGKADWDSLVFLDGTSGRVVDVFDEGFGIVSSLFFSGSEKTLLTYSPSGSLQYWDMETKRRKTRFSTEKDLTNTFFTAGGRFMIGERDGKVFMIDLLSGKVLATLPEKGEAAITVDTERDILYTLYREDRQTLLTRYEIASGIFSDRGTAEFPLGEEKPVMTAGVPGLFTGSSDGRIFRLKDTETKPRLLVRNTLQDIEEISIHSGYLALASDGRSILIPLESGTDFSPVLFDNPFEGPAGITGNGDGTFCVYRKTVAGTLYILDADNGFTREVQVSPTPLQEAQFLGNHRVIVLDKNSTIKVFDLSRETEDFSYSSFGIRSVVPIGGGLLMAGRNKTSALSAPLLIINPGTGETVPLEGDDIVNLDLSFDPARKTLYSLGIEDRGGVLKTVLKTHTGSSWEKSRTLLAFSGEDHWASFAVNSEKSLVFTSLGYGHVRMHQWGGFTSLERSSHIPEQLETEEDILVSLNTDNSITVWDHSSGRIVREIYFFSDGSYAVISAGGTYTADTGGQVYIHGTEGE